MSAAVGYRDVTAAGLRMHVAERGEGPLLLHGWPESWHGSQDVMRALPSIVPALHDVVTLPGCGHWTQQERPAEVNDALAGFLRALDG